MFFAFDLFLNVEETSVGLSYLSVSRLDYLLCFVFSIYICSLSFMISLLGVSHIFIFFSMRCVFVSLLTKNARVLHPFIEF